jgi:hypothetical protein
MSTRWKDRTATTPATIMSRTVPGVHHRPHHDAARPHLSLHLYRQAAGRAGRAGRGAERGVHSAAAKAVHRDHRLLPAAGRLQLPHGGGADEEAVRRPCQARDVRRLELPAPVHVYQVHRGGRRGREHPRLERSDLGHHHPGRSDPRHHPGRQHADRLSRLCLAGQRPGQQDGHRRHQQVAGRDQPRVGHDDP